MNENLKGLLNLETFVLICINYIIFREKPEMALVLWQPQTVDLLERLEELRKSSKRVDKQPNENDDSTEKTPKMDVVMEV